MLFLVYVNADTDTLTLETSEGDPIDAAEQLDCDVWHTGITCFDETGEVLARIPGNASSPLRSN